MNVVIRRSPWLCLASHARRIRVSWCSTAAHGTSASAPWDVSPQEPNYQDRAASSILTHGFVILRGLFSPDTLARIKHPMESRTDEVINQMAAKGVQIGVGSRVGFHEVVLRSPGRYDVPCEFDQVPAELMSSFEGIADKLLGEGGKVKKAFAGVVRAQPGSEAQIWHADSPHEDAEHKHPNMLNVLVALNDVTPDLGPTEVVPGSQVLTNHHRAAGKFDEEQLLYQRAGNSPELIGSTQKPAKATMSAGSALIFDDRMLHRGGGNQAATNRDVAFFSYARPSFVPATHYEAVRSLESYDHRSLAEGVRAEFPGLSPPGHEQVPVLADGASGSQLHESAIAAVADQLRYGTANIGGSYASSARAEAAVVGARDAMADFLGCEATEIAFGASMTALTFHLAHALRSSSRIMPGDNVVLDPISHGANVWTWIRLAAAVGAEVRWLPVAGEASGAVPGDCILDVQREGLANVIDARTRFVATGAASNGVGTVHDIAAICAAVRELSGGQALSFVDAVHFAPHGILDVKNIGCDFLACSPYKFFGPHAGVLYGRHELLASLPAVRLDCSDDSLPSVENGNMSRWELGTQNYEALAGVTAAVDYLAGLGNRFGGAAADAPRRDRLAAAWHAIAAHEGELKKRFLTGAADISGLRILGVAEADRIALRSATFAVAKEGLEPQQLAEKLCAAGVWCTAGNHYAGFWEAQSRGLATNSTGMTRLGLLHYNTLDEVDRILSALEGA